MLQQNTLTYDTAAAEHPTFNTAAAEPLHLILLQQNTLPYNTAESEHPTI